MTEHFGACSKKGRGHGMAKRSLNIRRQKVKRARTKPKAQVSVAAGKAYHSPRSAPAETEIGNAPGRKAFDDPIPF